MVSVLIHKVMFPFLVCRYCCSAEFETCLSLCSCLLGFSGDGICRQWLKDKVMVFPTSQNSAGKLFWDRDRFENSTSSPGSFLSSLESSTQSHGLTVYWADVENYDSMLSQDTCPANPCLSASSCSASQTKYPASDIETDWKILVRIECPQSTTKVRK